MLLNGGKSVDRLTDWRFPVGKEMMQQAEKRSFSGHLSILFLTIFTFLFGRHLERIRPSQSGSRPNAKWVWIGCLSTLLRCSISRRSLPSLLFSFANLNVWISFFLFRRIPFQSDFCLERSSRRLENFCPALTKNKCKSGKKRNKDNNLISFCKWTR